MELEDKMKFNIKKAREIWFQMIGESNKDFRQKCLNSMLGDIIQDLHRIKDHGEFYIVREYDDKKGVGKVIIEFKIK